MLKVNTAFNIFIKPKKKNGRLKHEIYKNKIPTLLFLVPSFTIRKFPRIRIVLYVQL